MNLFQVVRALNSVDLKDQQNMYASKLSGGQKRKLSVAVALIGDPKVMGEIFNEYINACTMLFFLL